MQAPSATLPISKLRTTSRAGLRDSVASSSTITGDESDAARAPSTHYSSEGEGIGTPRGASPRLGGRPLDRTTSFASTRSQGGEHGEMEGDMFHDRIESSVAAAEAGEEEAPEEESNDGFDDYRGNDTDDASDDEDIDEDGDVEYTLKDRQDVGRDSRFSVYVSS